MENLTGAQGFLLLHQHLRHMDWSKITKGVTQPEYLILTALHVHHQEAPDSQGLYVSALGEELSVSVSMISKLLRVLEEKGWILRTVDKNSRRNTFVTLTALGRKRLPDRIEGDEGLPPGRGGFSGTGTLYAAFKQRRHPVPGV